MAGFFLTTSILLWWVAHLSARPRARHGHACRLGVRLGDLALSGAGLHPPAADGQLGEAVPFGIFPHLDWTAAFSIRYGNLFYNPFHMLSIAFLYGSALLFAMHGAHHPGGQPLRRRARDRADRRPRHGGGARGAVLALDHGLQRDGRSRSIAGPGGSRCCARCAGGIGILLTGTVVDNWYLLGRQARTGTAEVEERPQTAPKLTRRARLRRHEASACGFPGLAGSVRPI